MNIIIVLGILFIVILLIRAIITEIKNRNIKRFYKVYTPNGLMLVKAMEEIRDTNKSLPSIGDIKLYNQMFGTDIRSLEEFEIVIGIEGHSEEPEGSLKSIAGEYILFLAHDLYCRYRNQYEILRGEGADVAMNKYGLNIANDEFIYDKINKVDWQEEKIVSKSKNYGGFSYNIGEVITYNSNTNGISENVKEDFTQIDRGTLYITNKRIIFVGTEKRENRTILIDDILEFSIFKNGILIGKNYGAKPLIYFSDYVLKSNRPPNKRDHLNRMIRVLERVFKKTQDREILIL